MAGSVCPSGYTLKSGDKPGFGDGNAGGISSNVVSASDCADLCNANTNCKSFEWSPTEKKCARNNIGNPPNSNAYKDYMYCMQEGEPLATDPNSDCPSTHC